jgi:RecA/RadA recombinase
MFDKIILYQPQNWIEQMMILESMLSPADVGKIGLIIVDSLTKLFRGIEFAGRGELHNKQPMIREYPIDLISIAKAYGCAMIYTSQIYQTPASNPFLPDWANEACVGGPSLQHQATYVVHLRRGPAITRIARLIDADDMPLAERPFVITEAGVEDMPDTAKAADLIKKAEEYEKKQTAYLLEEKKKRGKKSLIPETEEQTQSPAEINEPTESPAEVIDSPQDGES